MMYDQRIRDLITAIGTQFKAIKARLTAAETKANGAQPALGFTPENAANKGQPNGYASLDTGGKVPAAQLPSYVDDVLEFAKQADFPNPGETGKLYVALDSDRQYRWSGTAYRAIIASPGTTDAVPEGANNLYFTNKRAQDAMALILGDTDADLVALFNASLQ